MSRQDLAAAVGLHPKTLERRIKGTRPWGATELAAVASELKIEIGVLYGGVDGLFPGIVTGGYPTATGRYGSFVTTSSKSGQPTALRSTRKPGMVRHGEHATAA
jgi:hypothetical protein